MHPSSWPQISNSFAHAEVCKEQFISPQIIFIVSGSSVSAAWSDWRAVSGSASILARLSRQPSLALSAKHSSNCAGHEIWASYNFVSARGEDLVHLAHPFGVGGQTIGVRGRKKLFFQTFAEVCHHDISTNCVKVHVSQAVYDTATLRRIVVDTFG